MESSEKDYMEIDLMRLIKALWHRAWAIVISTVLAALIAFAYAALLITPLYKASALMYVNNSDISLPGSFTISTSQLSAAKSLVRTYTVILKTRKTLNEVIERAGLDYTVEKLKSMITTSSVDDTEIFKIEVLSPSPKEAEVIANTIATVLPDKISEIVNGSSVKIVDYAIVPSRKASPNITKYVMMGAFAGFVLCSAIIVVVELMDNLVHDEEYLLTTYKLPVLAAIPDLEESSQVSGSYGGYGSYGSTKKGGNS